MHPGVLRSPENVDNGRFSTEESAVGETVLDCVALIGHTVASVSRETGRGWHFSLRLNYRS